MKYLFLSVILLSCCSVTTRQENQASIIVDQTNQATPIPKAKHRSEEIVPNIPKASWEKSYFESINELSDKAGFKSLRNTALAKDDLEVRLWMGFGITQLEGFILKCIKNEWSAIQINEDHRNIRLDEPKSGWAQTWQKLVDSETLTLPDAESINCNPRDTDGFSYVVELKKGNNYRTYMYENPDGGFENKCKEAAQMENIIKIIVQDYGFK